MAFPDDFKSIKEFQGDNKFKLKIIIKVTFSSYFNPKWPGVYNENIGRGYIWEH